MRHLEEAVALHYQVSLLAYGGQAPGLRRCVHTCPLGAPLWAQPLLPGVLCLVCRDAVSVVHQLPLRGVPLVEIALPIVEKLKYVALALHQVRLPFYKVTRQRLRG